jgi:hypothetical protein
MNSKKNSCRGNYMRKYGISIGSPNGHSKKVLQMSSPNWDLVGVFWESAGSLLGVRWEPTGSLLRVHWESAGRPVGVCWGTLGVQISYFNGLSKWTLQKSSPNELSKLRPGWSLLLVRWKSTGSLLGVCWECDMWNPWNTISFQSSYFNWLSKWALQKSSPNELSKLRPGWSQLGICWESAFLSLK